MTKEKEHAFVENEEKLGKVSELILHNDDVNTFDFVIDTLIEICNHEPIQAEQVAMIVHYKGKCGVLSGDFYKLKPPYDEMTRRGLSVTID